MTQESLLPLVTQARQEAQAVQLDAIFVPQPSPHSVDPSGQFVTGLPAHEGATIAEVAMLRQAFANLEALLTIGY